MEKEKLHWIFSMIHKLTQNISCTDYAYCCGIVLRAVIALGQCINGMSFEYGREITYIRTSIYSIFFWEEGILFGNYGVYGIVIAAITLHAVYICGVIFLFVYRTEKLDCPKFIYKYCSFFIIFFLVGGVAIYGEIFCSYIAFLQDQNDKGFSEYFLLFFIVVSSIILAVEWGIIALLWNDVFWDSVLPWASFDSQLCNIANKITLMRKRGCDLYENFN